MKVYLVEKDNCESYEDFYKWIAGAYTTYRGATQSLLDEGFEVYYDTFWSGDDIRFYWQESDEYMADCQGAKILEFKVEDK